jgi:hypothetical protein
MVNDNIDTYASRAVLGLLDNDTIYELEKWTLSDSRANIEKFRKSHASSTCGMADLNDLVLSDYTDALRTIPNLARAYQRPYPPGGSNPRAIATLIRHETSVIEEEIREDFLGLPNCSAHANSARGGKIR